jgi:hypothetical protein
MLSVWTAAKQAEKAAREVGRNAYDLVQDIVESPDGLERGPAAWQFYKLIDGSVFVAVIKTVPGEHETFLTRLRRLETRKWNRRRHGRGGE